MLNRLNVLAKGMNSRFPEGNTPYQIVTRILEECGEVASEVNHFENSGTKSERHGMPSKENLAGEIKDAMNALMQLALYYDVDTELEDTIEKSITRLTAEGCIEEGE